MKNTAFVATYYNNPHFIELQAKTLSKYVEDSYDFFVLDDSEADTKSILTNNLARDEIKAECLKYGAIYTPIPQTIHQYMRNGGYVPNESPTTHHPTERHQALMRYLLTNPKKLKIDKYKHLVLMDADVFFKQPISVEAYMTHDIIATHRIQDIKLPLSEHHPAMFPPRVRELDGKTINFFTFFIMFVNLQRVTNLHSIDVGSWPATDTGSKSNFFITDNPQYSYKWLNERHVGEVRIDVVSKSDDFDEFGAEFVHYRAGSNWLYESSDYYKAKLHRMLKRYLPDLAKPEWDIHQDLTSRDGEHSLKKS